MTDKRSLSWTLQMLEFYKRQWENIIEAMVNKVPIASGEVETSLMTCFRERKQMPKFDNLDRETLLHLSKGPVWDGNLISKKARDRLVQYGLVERDKRGLNKLTSAGNAECIRLGYALGYLAEEEAIPF